MRIYGHTIAPGANLCGVDLQGQDLSGVDLHGA
ncbi:MAG: pentapeptide repeat-containing protein, partial [Ilumatobacteraceae bacterium]